MQTTGSLAEFGKPLCSKKRIWKENFKNNNQKNKTHRKMSLKAQSMKQTRKYNTVNDSLQIQ